MRGPGIEPGSPDVCFSVPLGGDLSGGLPHTIGNLKFYHLTTHAYEIIVTKHLKDY